MSNEQLSSDEREERVHDLTVNTGRYRTSKFDSGEEYRALLFRCERCSFEGTSSEDRTGNCPLDNGEQEQK